MIRSSCLFLFFLAMGIYLSGQQVYFSRSSASDSILLAKEMPELAQRVISIYQQEKDQKSYLGNLFMLQMVANQYAKAISSINFLRSVVKGGSTKYPELYSIQYELFSKAKLMEGSGNGTFRGEFERDFHAVHDHLEDKAAFYISTAFITRSGLGDLKKILKESLTRIKNDSLTLADAIALCRNYNIYEVFKLVEPLASPLLAEEEQKRFIIEDSVMIPTRDGTFINAWVVRKKGITIPQSAILQFTIYARPYPAGLSRVKDPVLNGYVGIMAYSRGKGYSRDEIFPYEHDGQDVYDVIDWITKQPWSNGKVGMFGGSYNGFTQWATTKNLHPALKTIVPSASVAPGLDVPMTNNVFMSFVFPWIYYVSNNRYLDDEDYNNIAGWDSLNTRWYALGKPYRSLDSLLGRCTNPIFQRWIAHPGYDKYWQSMIPYKKEFAKINIPVLTTTGYYDGGQIGAMYYYREHLYYNKNAVHYVLIGPYGHYGSQSFPDPVYNGYAIDPAANISIHDVIFQWFDYILKDSLRPSLLKDRINFELMGANEWKHAPALDNISNDNLRLYLDNDLLNTGYRLSDLKPVKKGFLAQQVDFADRTTINNYNHENQIMYDSLDASHGIVFVSDPMKNEISISGAFSGKLKASIDKKDMDFSAVLYELLPNGKYFYLSYFMGRASYAKDITKRHLLKPGHITSITFRNSYIISKKLSKGSRIVIVLNVNKSPDEQINYGTGKDVSDESIKDAATPLHIKWYNDSYVNIPILK
jgi:uncharacterized protein